MPAVWQSWVDQVTGEYVETVAVVTTKANSLLKQVHKSKNRMPTVLTEDLAYEWLLGDLDEKRIYKIGSFQYPPSEMQAFPIAKDFREALDPAREFQYEDLPAL